MKTSQILRVIWLSVLLLLPVSELVAQESRPKREFRGAWIQCVNGQFLGLGTQEMQRTLSYQLDELQKDGVNAIIFQVRAECDALYASRYEPWSRFLTGRQGTPPSPYWDPLQWMIDECHRRGMELHAWINPYRAKTKDTRELAVNHIAVTHPERVFDYDGLKILDPGQRENCDYILRIVGDIVSRYDVDGLHIDDYFYPTRDESIDRAEYEAYVSGGGDKGLNEWRRDSVSAFAAGLYSLVKSYGSDKIFSISPAGNIDGNENALFADVELWLSTPGYADYIIPQVYFGFENQSLPFEKTAKRWASVSDGRVGIIWGLAAYKCGTQDKNARSGSSEWAENSDIIARQLSFVRPLNAYCGFALFSYSYMFGKINENAKKEMQNLENML